MPHVTLSVYSSINNVNIHHHPLIYLHHGVCLTFWSNPMGECKQKYWKLTLMQPPNLVQIYICCNQCCLKLAWACALAVIGYWSSSQIEEKTRVRLVRFTDREWHSKCTVCWIVYKFEILELRTPCLVFFLVSGGLTYYNGISERNIKKLDMLEGSNL